MVKKKALNWCVPQNIWNRVWDVALTTAIKMEFDSVNSLINADENTLFSSLSLKAHFYCI